MNKVIEKAIRIVKENEPLNHLKDWIEGKKELQDEDVTSYVNRLNRIDYDRMRKPIADKLGIRASTLDSFRDHEKKQKGETGQGSPILFPEITPSREPVDGSILLDDLSKVFSNYMFLPAGAADLLAFWTVFTYLDDNFGISPILAVTSPRKRCGKSTLLAILKELTKKPLVINNTTPAALYRTIEKYSPTLLVDESDTFLHENKELIGILNSGHLKSNAYIIRAVGDDYEPVAFKTWSPKAISLIGKLPETLRDRSIEVRLQRKTQAEQIERFRADKPANIFATLREAITRWVEDSKDRLFEAEIPDFLEVNDRAADNWRVLFTIAQTAGMDWLNRAYLSAKLLFHVDDDDSARTLILEDLINMFEEQNVDKLDSHYIVEELGKMEDRPWTEWKNGKPITPRQLTKLLKPYDIESKVLKINSESKRGYTYSIIEPVFKRYCTPVTDEKKCNPVTNTDNSIQDKELVGYKTVTSYSSKRNHTLLTDKNKEKVTDESVTCNQSVTIDETSSSLYNKELKDSAMKSYKVTNKIQEKEGMLPDIPEAYIEGVVI